jgi:hypothetical protein
VEAVDVFEHQGDRDQQQDYRQGHAGVLRSS